MNGRVIDDCFRKVCGCNEVTVDANIQCMKTDGSISHSRLEETPEAKVRWFRSLSMSDRMEMLCSFTDLALSVNPSLQERSRLLD